MNRTEQFKKDLRAKRAVKVIAGIDNYDLESIKRVVSAADMGMASAVDVAAREDIIYVAKELTNIAVCVSSIEPEKLLMAKENGADILEIGNFDAMYKKGLRIGADEVIDITSRTLDLVGSDIMMSVTVPGHIDISEQIRLAQRLEEMGVDMIQTEGACVANVSNTGARGLLEKANVSIANTVELVRNVDIAVMTASGITPTTAPMAFAAGASAVGVGSCINKLTSTIEMIAVVRSFVEQHQSAREEILI